MRKLIVLLFLSLLMKEVNAQNIYGFSDNIFGSINLSSNTKDTLIIFEGNPWINLGFRSAIDRFNGRYFFGGSIPGLNGNFHIIDLVDLSIDSYPIYPENIEYDFIKDRLVYEKYGVLYSLDLTTLQQQNLGEIENGNSTIYGKTRTYVPQTNEYFYVDYINGYSGDPYFLMIDADFGEINCQETVEEIDGIFYVPSGLVTNNLTGEIIGHRGGKFGIVNGCEGTMTKLSMIEDYQAHLNNQMAVYNHNDNTYIIPYSSSTPNDKYKIAIVDVYNDEVIETISQPWGGKMNLQQIYDQPIAPLICLNDTLFLPKGQNYRWFLNDELIGETTTNYWIPTESGVYRAEVDFREYSTNSTEKDIILTSTDSKEFTDFINIYPNPASEFINIDFPYSHTVNIQIIELTGKVIYDDILKNTSMARIELNGFSKGVYLIAVETNNTNFTKLVMKF